NAATLRRMVVDLDMPAAIIPCPSVRESDGVVLGSRNVKLDADERRVATRIKEALDAAVDTLMAGGGDPDAVEELLRNRLDEVGRLEYAVVVDADTLQPVRPLRGDLRILVSVGFAKTNLMDNFGRTVPNP